MILNQIKRKVHICFVALRAFPVFIKSKTIRIIGGAEIQQSIISRALVKKGFEVSMICLDFGQKDNLLVDGVKIIKTHKINDGIPILRFIHPNSTSVWKAMKKVDADIYYYRCAGYLTSLISLFARMNKKRFVYAGASNTDFIPGYELIRYARDRFLFRKGLKKADTIIVQNEEQKMLCIENYNINTIIIPNLYRIESKALYRDSFILWSGRILELKRPELLIEIAEQLPDYKFIMIGGMASSKEYYHHIKFKASQIKNLEFLGFIPFCEAEKYFDNAAIIVNTSEYEGFPNTFLQAWSREKPTVSLFSLFPDSEVSPPGFYVKNIEEVTEIIRKLMKSKKYLNDSGKKCKEYFDEHYSVSAVIQNYVELINKLML